MDVAGEELDWLVEQAVALGPPEDCDVDKVASADARPSIMRLKQALRACREWDFDTPLCLFGLFVRDENTPGRIEPTLEHLIAEWTNMIEKEQEVASLMADKKKKAIESHLRKRVISTSPQVANDILQGDSLVDSACTRGILRFERNWRGDISELMIRALGPSECELALDALALLIESAGRRFLRRVSLSFRQRDAYEEASHLLLQNELPHLRQLSLGEDVRPHVHAIGLLPQLCDRLLPQLDLLELSGTYELPSLRLSQMRRFVGHASSFVANQERHHLPQLESIKFMAPCSLADVDRLRLTRNIGSIQELSLPVDVDDDAEMNEGRVLVALADAEFSENLSVLNLSQSNLDAREVGMLLSGFSWSFPSLRQVSLPPVRSARDIDMVQSAFANDFPQASVHFTQQ